MPFAAAIPLITAGIGALGSIFGGRGRTRQNTENTPHYRFPLDPPTDQTSNPLLQGLSNRFRAGGGATSDRAAWESFMREQGYHDGPTGFGGVRARFKPPMPEQAGAGQTGELQQDFMDLLRQQLSRYGESGSGHGGFSIPHVSFNPAHATHAVASLIDMMDKAFQVEPDANLREDIYTRLKSGAQASANDSIRKITDSARNAGVGPNAPWVQQLMSEANQGAAKDSTQGLTDFFDAYIQASLARRAAALGENAQLQTGVNTFNAGQDNQVAMFNSSGQLEAARANQQGAMWEGQLGLEGERVHQGDLDSILRMLQFGLTPQQTGSTQTTTQSGGGNAAAGLTDLASRLLSRYGGGRPDASSGGSSYTYPGGYPYPSVEPPPFDPTVLTDPFHFNTDPGWQLGG